MRKYISVDRKVIDWNATHKRNDPPLVVEFDDHEPFYGYDITIKGPSKLVYRPANPEGRINSVWIETEAELFVEVPMVHENGPTLVTIP